MIIFRSLTDSQRFKGIKVNYSKQGVPSWIMSENTKKTPEINRLLNEKNNPLIPELKFVDGVLHVEDGASYRVPTRFHGLQAFSFSNTGGAYWKPSYDMPNQMFDYFLTHEEQEDIYMTRQTLSAFESKDLDTFFSRISWFNPRTNAANELLKWGAPRGEYIKISKYDEKFMIDYNDSIYTEEDIENIRSAYNADDFCKAWNHPPGTIFRIEGQDYEVDENWQLHIPEGVICTPCRLEIIKKNDLSK